MQKNWIIILFIAPICKAQQNQPEDQLNCLAMVCNFEQGNLCNYENVESSEVTSPGAWKKFDVSKRAFRNLATGVRYPGEGSVFASTYLKSGEKAMLESVGALKADGIRYVFPLRSDRIIRFKVYKVADKMELKGCCDTVTSCPFTTESDVKITDFNKWKTANFICKAGTQKILFYGINHGSNEGAIGLDDIQLYLPAYVSADKAEINACFKPAGDGNVPIMIIPNTDGSPTSAGNSNGGQPTNVDSSATGNGGQPTNVGSSATGNGGQPTNVGSPGANSNGDGSNLNNGAESGSGNGNSNFGGSGSNGGNLNNGRNTGNDSRNSGSWSGGMTNNGGNVRNSAGTPNNNGNNGNFGGNSNKNGNGNNSNTAPGNQGQGTDSKSNGENTGNINTDNNNNSVGRNVISISFADNPNNFGSGAPAIKSRTL